MTAISDIEIKIRYLLYLYFRDEEKVQLWLDSANPNMGYAVPIELIHRGEGEKVLKFIKAARNENTAE